MVIHAGWSLLQMNSLQGLDGALFHISVWSLVVEVQFSLGGSYRTRLG
jgi:hypothetical protein